MGITGNLYRSMVLSGAAMLSDKKEEITSSDEYRFLAKMFTDVYAEKECLKSKVRTLIADNIKLTNEIWILKGKENGKRK